MRYLKIKVVQKLVAFLTVLTFLLQSNLVLATDICFTNLSSARQSAAFIDFTLKTNSKNIEVINLLKQENSNYLSLSESYKENIMFLEKDKSILKKRGDDFQQEFLKTSNELNKCIDSKPSRMVWYGAGFITAFILGVATIFMIQK